jgi:hypothetical protein
MLLTNLEPNFICYETKVEEYEVVDGDPQTWRERGCPTKKVTGPREYKNFLPSISGAEGIIFLCPKCFIEKNGKVGVHSCEVTFKGQVADEVGTHNKEGNPVRWDVSGDKMENLTINPSILLDGGCGWHGWIKDGQIE